MILPRTTQSPWQTRTSRIAYEARALRIREDEVIRPDGQPGHYSYVEYAYPVACIVALDGDQRIYLVRQWRYPWGCDSWEIPGGSCGDDDPLTGAQRELREEAGLVARSWTPLGTFFVSASIAARFHLFLARDLEEVATERDPEEQDMLAQPVPLVLALAAAADGTIMHAATITALYKLTHFLAQEHAAR